MAYIRYNEHVEKTVTTKKDGTITIEVQISAEEMQKAKKQAIANFAPHINAPGFRKGKAPIHMIEKEIRAEKLAEEALSMVAGEAYRLAIEEHKLEPITQPVVSVPATDGKSVEEIRDEAWPHIVKEGVSLTITTFTKPEVSLGEWQKAVKKVKKQEPTVEIETAKDDKEVEAKSKDKKEALNPQQVERAYEEELLETLVETAEIEIPEMIVNGEAQQMLMQQVQMIEQFGMSFEDYLKSQDKSPEDLQKELKGDAEKNVKIRFIMGALADELKDELATEEPKVQDIINYLKQLNESGTPKKEAKEPKEKKTPTKKETKPKAKKSPAKK